MHSGKTTISKHLIEKHAFRRHSFAGPLKADLAHMGFSATAIEQKPAWMRSLMQAYGQARRAEDPNHWSGIMEHVLAEEFGNIVIDDMRFPNEYEMLRKLGERPEIMVQLVRVMRLGYERDTIEHAQDESETALDSYGDWDAVVTAVSGDLKGLVQQAETGLGLEYRG